MSSWNQPDRSDPSRRTCQATCPGVPTYVNSRLRTCVKLEVNLPASSDSLSLYISTISIYSLLIHLTRCPHDLKRLAYISMYGVASSMPAPCETISSPRTSTSYEEVHWISSDYNLNSSITDILRTLRLDPLQERRCMSRLVVVYKILNDSVAVRVSHMDIVRLINLCKAAAQAGTGCPTDWNLWVEELFHSKESGSVVLRPTLTLSHRQIPYCLLGIAWHPTPAHKWLRQNPIAVLWCTDIYMEIAIINDIQIQLGIRGAGDTVDRCHSTKCGVI